ncbi:hypothetical protein FJY69_06860, partial [candidate division WOR-3 bacterium]|nr:hypothetical protein [candidate division WOR-3 bacterium]
MRYGSLLLAVCLLAPAEAQLLPTGEFVVDTIPRYRPSKAYSPSVGASGSEFLAAWSGMMRRPVRTSRVTSGGALQDTGGLTLGSAAYSGPMAFGGSQFLLVWYAGATGSRNIHGARFRADGTVLDPDGFVISSATGDQQYPAVAYDGTQFVVAWEDRRSGNWDVYTARVSSAGNVLDPDGIAVCTDPAEQGIPRISGSGSGSLVAWHDAREDDSFDIYAARVNPSGTVLDPTGIRLTAGNCGQYSPAVAWGGGQWLVTWVDDRDGDWYFDVWAARVSPAGTVLDPDGFAVTDTVWDQDEVGVVHNGTNFLVYWADYRSGGGAYADVYCGRVSGSGSVLDRNGFAVTTAAGDQYTISAAVLNGTTFVAWEDTRDEDNPTVYGARVSSAGTVLDPGGFALAHCATAQSGPALAYDGTNWLAVWSEMRGANADVYGQRFTGTGVRLDAEPFLVSGAADDQSGPVVGFDGANWLVAWEDERWGNVDLYAARVSPAGRVLDSLGISVFRGSYAQGKPALAFDGTNWLVAYDNWVTNTHDVFARFVSPAGVVDTHTVRIATASGNLYAPALAFDGANYLAVWTDGRASVSKVRCARVTTAGAVLDTGIRVADSAAAPGVVFGGGQYFVAWADYLRNRWVGDIAGARVSTAGIVLDPNRIMLCAQDSTQTRPTAGFDGSAYVIVWEDARNGGPANCDLYGASVTAAGALRDTFAVCRDPGQQFYARIGSGPGALGLVYQGWTDAFAGRCYNALRTWAKLSPLPGAEETPSPEVRTANVGPTVVRGVLSLPASGEGRMANGELLDISGRSVMELQPGPNDVRRLAPGVYF